MPHDNRKLLELARYLVPDDPSLVDEVHQAIEHPGDYVRRYAERLGERRTDEPTAARGRLEGQHRGPRLERRG